MQLTIFDGKPHLVRTFTSLGGIMQRVPRLASLADARKYAKAPLAIVNCTGLGARDVRPVPFDGLRPPGKEPSQRER